MEANGEKRGKRLQIDFDRSSEFDDARMILLHKSQKQPLRDFCNVKPVPYRDMRDGDGSRG